MTTNDYYCGNNTNGQEEDGLLPPLRSPHINEIPPDLLAFMLKSPIFEEILAQPHRLQQQIPINGQSNEGNQGENVTVGRSQASRTNSLDTSNISNISSSQIKKNQNDPHSSLDPANAKASFPRSPTQESGENSTNAKLSPLAKEFVPKPYSSDQQTTELAIAFAQVQASMQNSFSNQNNSPQSQSLNDVDMSTDCILSTVTDTINQLTVNPPDFHRCAKTTTDVLKRYLFDADILGIVVTLLVEQSISNSNFCYSGARLCQVLHRNEIKTSETTFKNVLISRCQEEFQNCLKNLETEIEPKRTQGFLMFLGELYMNFQIEQGDKTSPITIFGLAATELMNKLVTKSPTYENIKFIFQLLKLLGWEFENATDSRLKSEMEKFIRELSYILVTKKLSEEALKILEALFDLKRRNWNKSEDSRPGDKKHLSYAPTEHYTETQYFELPDEVDEDDYDGGQIFLDDEPDDVAEAYDEFLRETKAGK